MTTSPSCYHVSRTRAENVLRGKRHAMSALEAPIDYKNLEEELHAALAADKLYKLQNDAKIRAIEQGVPTYEHFRQMVNGAHLKPLERNDMKPKIGVQWNPLINPAKSRDSTALAGSKKSTCDKGSKGNTAKRSPGTYENFLQSWRIIEDSEKFTYAWNLRNDLQRGVFRVEIPTSFLGDFANACLQHLSKVDDVTSVTELLGILSTCNRFDLAVCFMTSDEKSVCERLFQQLRLREEESPDESLESAVKSLAARYRVELD